MHSEHDETTTESVDSDPESDDEENKSNAGDNNSEMEKNVSKSDTKNMFEKYTFCKTCNKKCAQNKCQHSVYTLNFNTIIDWSSELVTHKQNNNGLNSV